MNTIPTKNNVKVMLVDELLKQGMSLEDFEAALEKKAFLNTLGNVGYAGLLGSTGVGLSGAALLLALEQMSKNQEEDLDEEEKILDNEEKLLLELKGELEAEKALA